MSLATQELKKELERTVEVLKTLRDEVRLKVHLAGMDLKREWDDLEPHLEDVQKAARETTHASHAAVKEALKKVQKFSALL
jgi:uncharacterized protein (DUF111 family)